MSQIRSVKWSLNDVHSYNTACNKNLCWIVTLCSLCVVVTVCSLFRTKVTATFADNCAEWRTYIHTDRQADQYKTIYYVFWIDSTKPVSLCKQPVPELLLVSFLVLNNRPSVNNNNKHLKTEMKTRHISSIRAVISPCCGNSFSRYDKTANRKCLWLWRETVLLISDRFVHWDFIVLFHTERSEETRRW